jgi:hypothetical protein
MTDEPYEPGSLLQVAAEMDSTGDIGEQLVVRILGAVEDAHVAIAVDALCFVLASALRSAPRGMRAAMTDEQLERIREAVLESLD